VGLKAVFRFIFGVKAVPSFWVDTSIPLNTDFFRYFGVYCCVSGKGTALDIHSNAKLVDVPAFANYQMVYSGNQISLHDNFLLASLTGWDNIKCTHVDECALNWYYNYALTKDDVCTVWDGIAGQEGGSKPKKTSTGCTGSGYHPCYGGTSGNSGTGANC
jgi:hypothetical protein